VPEPRGQAPPSAEAADAAASAGLRYVSDDEPGFRRLRRGKGFRYVDADGKPVTERSALKRLRGLAIPPAYTDVWISPDPLGHIQATGRDSRHRKQYRYHPDWRAVRDGTKFERTFAFGRALPAIRRRIEQDLARPGLGREKVLATTVHLLDTTLIRVGNDEYSRDNNSFGLTTLRNRHVRVSGTALSFTFIGKGGKPWKVSLRDRRLARLVKSFQDLPGQRLFQYLDETGTPRTIGSSDVNDYLREIGGADFTAKDFRTWAGTVLAAHALSLLERPETEAAAKRNLRTAVDAVAGTLGNTPAICRKCYVHPEVVEAYLAGDLAGHFAGRRRRAGLRPEESALLDLLGKRSPPAARAQRRGRTAMVGATGIEPVTPTMSR
jgi:DNA topoisomerase I